MSTQTEIRIGSEFVGYRIDELIGRGGMGVVYRAYDLRLKRTVALKLMAPELALDRALPRPLLARGGARHVARAPERGADPRRRRHRRSPLPRDALVEGTDLGALLRAEGALEPARALAICGQVANALDAAHAKGLVHRDVKPSNVLLDASEHVYLADFGLTRRLDEQSGPAGEGRSVGTPAYLAPEQIEGGSIDGRTDVYSLGCLLYECLTGETPFARGSRLAVAWAHLEEEPPSARARRPELPEAIDAVIRKAMAKEPEDRYTTCAALIGAAEEALGLRRSPPLHRRKALLLVAAVLVAALVAAALAAALATGGHAKAAATPLFARKDTVARIDPRTNKVSAVVAVGPSPVVAAAGGHSVWVYNQGDSTISEIDARTNRVRKTTPIRPWPADVSRYTGPVLAADASGAWFVSGALDVPPGDPDHPLLTKVLPGGRGKREYRLDVTPTGVAVERRRGVGCGPGRTRLRGAAHRSGHGTGHGTDAVSRLRADRLGRGGLWQGLGRRLDPRHALPDRCDARPSDWTAESARWLGSSRASRPEIMPRGGNIWIRLAGRTGISVNPSFSRYLGAW